MTTSKDPHPYLVSQATRLYELGIVAELCKRARQPRWSLGNYIVTLPTPCLECLAEAEVTKDGPKENRLGYFLVEPRAGLVMPCESMKIVYDGNDETFVDQRAVPARPYWTLLNNGWKNRNRRSRDSLAEFCVTPGILAARVMDGVFGYIQDREIIANLEEDTQEGYAMDLNGSYAPGRCDSAELVMYRRQVKLLLVYGGGKFPRCGAAFSRECHHHAR